MLRSCLCDQSDAYILVKQTITVADITAQDAASKATNKKVIFNNHSPIINVRSRINNTQIDDAHDVDAVMSIYNLREYSANYLKAS